MLSIWYWYRRRTRYSFKPVILVTGCGSGIGLALAECLYRIKSYRLVFTARRSRLESLRQKFVENDRCWIRELDVTNEKHRELLLQEIHEKWEGVNILVNCAGISYRSVLEHMTEQDEQLQLATNYLGPVALIRGVLPKMREEGRGKIINVSSVSGILAMPTMASYTASKYALEGASEALWYEVKPLGINVSLIQPGFVHSKSYKNVYYTKAAKKAEEAGDDLPYGDYYSNMTPFVARLMRLSVTKPTSIAKLVLKVIRTENPPLWVPATYDALIFYYLRRFVPRRILLFVLFSALPRVRRWGDKYTKRRR
ncbi:MAG: SDR family NAD(P)-dependent oxidoreductase [Bdellovibrionales bacterium]